MGGLVIETIRPGVQFVPDAAAAFRRADAQVRAEFGRGIDVNSTYRSWADQMVMFVNWGRYVAGKGPYPGHSKAVHPSESYHVAGVALDSDDWRIPRIVAILAENGFIRNRLHVPNENHHFEWLRNRDQNFGKPIGGSAASTSSVPEEDDDMLTIKWGDHIFTVDKSYLKHETNGKQAAVMGWLFNRNDRMAKGSTLVGVDNDAVNALQKTLSIPWYAFELVMSGRGYNIDGTRGDGKGENGRVWSLQHEINAKLDGIRLDTTGLAKSLDELSEKFGI